MPANQKDVIYHEQEMAYEIGEELWESLFAYDVSPNQRYVIYVASHLNENPVAILYVCETNTNTRLTDNGYFIEVNPHVDDQGN